MCPPGPVLADAGYGDSAEFRQGLTERSLLYVRGVTHTATAHPATAEPVRAPYRGNGRPPVAAYPDPPSELKALALAAGRSAARWVTWRRGTHYSPDNPQAAMRSRFLALRVRPAGRSVTRAADRSLPERWLLAEWPPARTNPPTTGCRLCPPTSHSAASCGSPSCAGGSNTITANSKTASASTTTKAVP